MGIKGIILICVFFLAQNAKATVYFTAFDPSTKSIALVYSSSGGNFWQTLVKGRGMVGAQASGLCQNATPKVFLDQGFSAEEIAQRISRQCKKVDWTAYRLSIITTDGLMSSYIAETGCHSGNIYCGNVTAPNFSITGGGLEEGVLNSAADAWKALSNSSFICRLYQTLEAVYQAGGEKKDFRGASIAIDDPRLSQLIYFKAEGDEKILLGEIKKQMKNNGIQCAGF